MSYRPRYLRVPGKAMMRKLPRELMRCTVALNKNLKGVLLKPFQTFGSRAVRLAEMDGEPPLVTFSFFKVVSAQAHTTTVISHPPGLDGSYHETHGHEEPQSHRPRDIAKDHIVSAEATDVSGTGLVAGAENA